MNDDDLRRFAPRDPDDERDGVAADETDASTDAERALEETVMARLREADPAADVEASAELPAAVAERVRDLEVDADTDSDSVREPIPLARRRRAWHAPAAAAAAAALVVASAYAIGSGGIFEGGASSAADQAEAASAPAPISLGDSAGGDESAAATESSVFGSAEQFAQQDMAMTARGGAADSMIGWGGGRTTFSGTGLSSAARSAQAYGLDAASPSTAERMAQVAAGLGMTGTPEVDEGRWTLTDGEARLDVGLDGSLGLSYYDNAAQPWCEGCEEPRPQDAPSGEDAVARLKELLTAIGEDPAEYEYAAPTYEGAVTATAEARRIVGGQGTDLVVALDLAPAGVVSVWGSLADVVDLGTYDVVSEQEGLERLSDPRFGGYRTSWPMPIDGDMTVMNEYVPPTEAPAAPQPGVSVSWPVRSVEIVSARLGLAQQWQPDGSVLLVPSYEFADADGSTWSVIAVGEDRLDFTAEQR